ncbi:unnamed protein product [Porites evermanni]|uniref:Uncharacterized protein n=1 Tax=Porites evermanni TaxID=104178 RepID=A0ABN8S7J6_9CNID|nr:unnamed protein product [Porites evermanni]
MSRLFLAWSLLCLALVIDAQQAERTTGNDVTEEEPHPYTISFFLFPHKQTVESSESKGNKTSHITQQDKKKLNSTKVEGNLTDSKDAPPEDDVDLTYQHGSVNHPAHEMYPMCHHCPKNSTYEECTHKRTLKRCDSGLSNICFTKSIKRDNIVHYNMGCANHKQCQRARAKPCKAHKKHCFTCCQWSGCNSVAHHDGTTSFSFWNAGHVVKIGWGALGVSFLTFIAMFFL